MKHNWLKIALRVLRALLFLHDTAHQQKKDNTSSAEE